MLRAILRRRLGIHRSASSARVLVGIAFAAGWALGARDACACAVCAAGDPTLTTMGAEKPFAGRLRGSAELRLGGIEVDGIDLTELRLDLGVAYAPTSSLVLSLDVPALDRWITSPESAGAPAQAGSSNAVTRVSLGDVEARIKDVLWTSREGRLSMQLALFAGAKAPTAPVEDDAFGRVLPADLQPGCSSIVPLAGGFYSLRGGDVSFFASASFYLPVPVRDAPHVGDSFRTTAVLALQPTPKLATQLGIATRLDQPGETLGGADDPSSGGFVGYVSSEIVWSPVTDLLLSAGTFVPVVQVLRGDHRERSIASLGMTYDFF